MDSDILQCTEIYNVNTKTTFKIGFPSIKTQQHHETFSFIILLLYDKNISISHIFPDSPTDLHTPSPK